MKLRKYQQKAVEAALSNNRALLVLPTGTGKSHIIASIVEHYAKEGKKVLMLTHSKELVQQNADKLAHYINVSIACASIGEPCFASETAVFASIQTANSRINDLPHFDCVIVDEAHRVDPRAKTQYKKVLTKIDPDNLVGLTATPYREDGILIYGHDEAVFGEHIAYEYTVEEALAEGYIMPLEVEPTAQDYTASCTRISRTGMSKKDLVALVNEQQELTRQIVQSARLGAHNLFFTVSLMHSALVKASLAKRNEDSVCISGETPSKERDTIIKEFKDGKIKNLINCEVLTTGFDAPCITDIYILRALQSHSLYMQILGRGSRPCEGKELFTLHDYGGNDRRLGDWRYINEYIEASFVSKDKRPVLKKFCQGNKHILKETLKLMSECPSDCTHCHKKPPFLKLCKHCDHWIDPYTEYCPNCAEWLWGTSQEPKMPNALKSTGKGIAKRRVKTVTSIDFLDTGDCVAIATPKCRGFFTSRRDGEDAGAIASYIVRKVFNITKNQSTKRIMSLGACQIHYSILGRKVTIDLIKPLTKTQINRYIKENQSRFLENLLPKR